jgi:hypothetical protein
MKRVAAFVLALALFAAPALAVAGASYGETTQATESPARAATGEWNGPSLEQMFGDNFVESNLLGE